jgi:hypothetical protein
VPMAGVAVGLASVFVTGMSGISSAVLAI